jgi:hypothetical protein
MAFFEERIEKGVIAKLQGIVDKPFVRMDYTEAIRILESSKQKFEYPVKWGMDLQSEHERFLAEKHVGGPVILMNYPKEIKAFYMRMNDDGKTVAAMDVLAPGIGEIIGGSQREERPRRPRQAHHGVGPRSRGVFLVSRPSPIWHRPPCGLWPRIRKNRGLRDGTVQRARRYTFSQDPRERALLEPCSVAYSIFWAAAPAVKRCRRDTTAASAASGSIASTRSRCSTTRRGATRASGACAKSSHSSSTTAT